MSMSMNNNKIINRLLITMTLIISLYIISCRSGISSNYILHLTYQDGTKEDKKMINKDLPDWSIDRAGCVRVNSGEYMCGVREFTYTEIK